MRHFLCVHQREPQTLLWRTGRCQAFVSNAWSFKTPCAFVMYFRVSAALCLKRTFCLNNSKQKASSPLPPSLHVNPKQRPG